MTMRTAEVELTGMTPGLISTKYTPDDDFTEEYADNKLHRNAEGNVIIPSEALEQAMQQVAGSPDIVGKTMKKTEWKKKFMSSVFVTEDLNLNRKDCDEIRTDKVIRDRGKMVLTHRPWIKEWSAKTTIRFNDGIGLTPKKLKDILIYAGERQGLLSYRPKFGRFEVTGFNVLN